MSEPPVMAPALPEEARVLRCPHCDVLWRGTADVACWCCGATGTPRGDVRLVGDDD